MFSHEDEGIDRFSDLRWCTFHVAVGAGSSFPVGWHTAGGGSNSVFWGSFASIGEINFFLGMGTGRWVILPWGFDIILIFPNFRRF